MYDKKTEKTEKIEKECDCFITAICSEEYMASGYHIRRKRRYGWRA